MQKELETDLAEQGVLVTTTTKVSGIFGHREDAIETATHPPTFMDDLVILVEADGAEELVDKVRSATISMANACRRHGLAMNMAPGKQRLF